MPSLWRSVAPAAAVLAALAGLMPLRASADEVGWGVAQLMQALAQVKRSEARFTERRYLKVLKAPLQSSGTLTFRAPDRLEKRTLKPRAEALIVDGGNLTIEGADGKSRTLKLQDHAVLWAFVESIRATLGGDAATLERFYKADLEGGPGGWQLYLSPRERSMSKVISLIRIGGSGSRVELIEVRESGGDRSVMRIVEGGP